MEKIRRVCSKCWYWEDCTKPTEPRNGKCYVLPAIVKRFPNDRGCKEWTARDIWDEKDKGEA